MNTEIDGWKKWMTRREARHIYRMEAKTAMYATERKLIRDRCNQRARRAEAKERT